MKLNYYNQRGFTLLELLIAAAIIGVLAMFATQSFRETASQTRVEEAKVRAKAVAMAARRFLIDYPKAASSVSSDKFGVVSAAGTCNHSRLSLQNLINCEYLDYRQYAAEARSGDKYMTNFEMYFSGTDGTVCFKAAAKSKVTDSATYCTDGERVW